MKNFIQVGVGWYIVWCDSRFYSADFRSRSRTCSSTQQKKKARCPASFKSVEVSGFLDTYYSYNFSRPDDRRASSDLYAMAELS